MTTFLTKLKVLNNNRFIINRMKHTHSGQHYSCDVVAVHDRLCHLCRNQHSPKINWNHNDQIPELNMPNKDDYMRFIIANHIERNKFNIKKIKVHRRREGIKKWKSAYICGDLCSGS